MISLTRLEGNRFLSRRGIVLVLLAGIVVIAVLAGKTAWDSRPMSAGERSDARAQAALAAKDPQLVAELKDCRAHPSRYLGAGATKAECVITLDPNAKQIAGRQPLSLSQSEQNDGPRVAVLLAAALVIAAATFAGADWATGSMRTQLLVRPRRLQLWAAKALAVTLLSAVYAAVGFALYFVALGIVADARGISTPSHTVETLTWMGLRATALGAGVGLGSFALTMLFRHTVATLGVLFAYAAGGEVLLALLPFDGAARWSIGNNMFGWLRSGFTYLDQSLNCGSVASCGSVRHLGHLDAAWFLAVLLIVAVVGSVATFVRRDV